MFEYYEYRNAEGHFTIERVLLGDKGKRGSKRWGATVNGEILAQGQDPSEVLEKLVSGDCKRTSTGLNPPDCRLPSSIALWERVSR